jgi:hypothetical protein
MNEFINYCILPGMLILGGCYLIFFRKKFSGDTFEEEQSLWMGLLWLAMGISIIAGYLIFK